MACRRCEISTFIEDNGVDLFIVTETWLSAQDDDAKIVHYHQVDLTCYHSHVNRDLVSVELLQYTNVS